MDDERGFPLELDQVARQQLAEQVIAYADAFVARRASGRASSDPVDEAVLRLLLAPPAEEGGELDPLLEALETAIDTGFDTASGRHMSYIPSGSLYTAALGDFLGAVTNRYTGGNQASPGSVAIEQSVVRWLCSLFGFGEGSAGILFSGGSIANLTAMVTARSQLGDDFRDGTVYTSERAHHSVEKAARIAGISDDRVRLIPADASLRLDVDVLRAAIAADLDAGLRPMIIAATAGTTDTGTIDPLGACAEIAREAGAWFHVDAAYGGFFVLADRGRDRLAGIERADSITLDVHKSLFVPFGVGGLVVRDRRALVEAHEGRGAYMQDLVDSDVLPHYFSMGPELTRPFRGLAVWLPLHLHGVGRFRAELDRMLDLADWASAQISQVPGLELATITELSIVSFRSSTGDDDTRRIFDGINASGVAHVSSTTVADRFTIRLALLSPRTTREMVVEVVKVIWELASA